MRGKLRQGFATLPRVMAFYFAFLFVRGNGIHVLTRFGNTVRIVYTLQLTARIYNNILSYLKHHLQRADTHPQTGKNKQLDQGFQTRSCLTGSFLTGSVNQPGNSAIGNRNVILCNSLSRNCSDFFTIHTERYPDI